MRLPPPPPPPLTLLLATVLLLTVNQLPQVTKIVVRNESLDYQYFQVPTLVEIASANGSSLSQHWQLQYSLSFENASSNTASLSQQREKAKKSSESMDLRLTETKGPGGMVAGENKSAASDETLISTEVKSASFKSPPLSPLFIHSPICYTNSSTQQDYCCAHSWDHDLDDWWQHHSDWEASLENETTYCFSPIASQRRAEFLRQLYKLQFPQDCNNTHAFLIINSGYSANLGLLGKAFLTSFLYQRTFVESKRVPDFLWRYASRNGTGVCPSQDMDCFFLPISNCTAQIKQSDGFNKTLCDRNGGNYGRKISYLRHYLTRPRYWLRRRVHDLVRSVPLSAPCTVLHVRRTDVVLEGNWRKKRHYFKIQDYLDHVKEGQNILLLTDDHSAIEEALHYHKGRNISYIQRVRWKGPEGGFNGHLPSGDPIHEMAVILAELQLAQKCRALVHTRSGYADVVLNSMDVASDFHVHRTRIDVGRQPNETYFVTAEQFLAQFNYTNSTLTTDRNATTR